MYSKVYLIHRRGKLRAAKSLQNQLFSKGNVVILWNTEAEAIKGDGAVESLLLQDHVTGEKKEISLQGVFIAVGIQPGNSMLLKALWIWNRLYQSRRSGNYFCTWYLCSRRCENKKLRQIVTAAADGANAVTSAEQYLSDLKRG